MTQVDVSQALYAVESAIAGRLMRQELPSPRTHEREEWPPDYARVLAWRRQQLARFEEDPDLLESAREWYGGADLMRAGCVDPEKWAERCCAWINHWVDTYDPRNVGKPGMTTRIPLILFPRQEVLVWFVLACMLGDAAGLVDKSRDMGATWVLLAVSAWLWVFFPGMAIGWGSNNLDSVDKIGDPDSIFEKLRALIRLLPDCFRPAAEEGVDLKHTVCRNPDNGAVISGQGGKNIGRGGRRRIYFVDESDFLEYAEAVEASLSENTRCRIDLSTPSGLGTVFQRTREAGAEWAPGAAVRRDVANVFILDWRDHPAKSPEWYSQRRKYFESKGMPQVVAREIDRNPMGAAEGIIINYEWVEAAVDAHILLGLDASGGNWDALDVADGGPDSNALVGGRGVVVTRAQEWGERDPGATARRAFRACRENRPTVLQYDCIGMGTNVKSEFNRLTQDDAVDVSWLKLVPWAANAAVVDPGERVIKNDRESPTNKNYFENFKAQAWWNVGQSFYRAFQAVQAHRRGDIVRSDESGLVFRDESGSEIEYKVEELISISTSIPQPIRLRLMKELSQAVMTQSSRLKLLVDKAPNGARSPNLADGLIMGRFPARPASSGRISMFGPKIL